ncbi:amino acid adenylation domain-containing protein [Brevibacillus borstelensis]|uniref:amino acid adenylation domain-containing protein n=1 Tax=Brevibacillus borstelensis TaxID=45462 RepID=UPI003CC90CFA
MKTPDHVELEASLLAFICTETDYPRDKTIHQLFEEQVERTPDRVALVFENVRLTYRQLNVKANQLARILQEKGVHRDQVVGIMVERSSEMVIGILAVLKAGGAYLPIDVEYPLDRIEYILQDSQTKVVLTQKHLVDLVLGAGFKDSLVLLDEQTSSSQPKTNLDVDSKPDDLAYVIYTSGTTGKPKGTLLEHKGIANVIPFYQKILEITSEDRIGQFASISFDASVSEFFMALFTGASLHIIPKDTINDLPRFEEYMNQHAITIITLPPTYLVHLAPERITTLRKLITAGSATSVPLIDRWKDRVTYINAYGPTEASICATAWVATSDEPHYRLVPIGKPIQNTKIYIVDEQLAPQPIGEAGELCISGVGLARGYWNRPDLTAEKFVDNPFEPGKKMYRTGDLARWLPDGNIQFLGRSDDQVKIRGHRIELGEIEKVLVKHERIKEAAVVAREDHLGQQCLCAYFVPTAPVTSAELREFATRELPVYMIPAHFVKLDKMPLTPNDKVDRKALPEPDPTQTEHEYEAPQNPTQEILATIWQDVLGVKRVGIRDSFFALGGDSIKAIQVAARLHAHQLKVETRFLLKYPTIEQVAPYVTHIGRKSEQGIVSGHVPFTPIQHWFFERNFASMHHWNQSYMLYRAHGFDEAALRKAIAKLVEHHDALRMVYRSENGKILQVNRGLEGEWYDFLTYDFRTHDNEEQAIEKETKRLHSCIRLDEGPLVKAALFQTSRGDHLFIVIHHLVADGVSWRILLEDLASAYTQALEQEDIVLPEKTDSFKDWSIRLQEYANQGEAVRELPYWQAVVSEAAHVALPKDFDSIDCRQSSIRNARMELSVEATEQLLKRVNQAYSTEINDILLSALGLAVRKWAGMEKIVINLEGHGREDIVEQANVSRTVGWFTAQYPVVLPITETEDLSLFIKRTKEHLRKIPYKGIGYEILKYLTAEMPRSSLSCLPKPEINFNYLGQFDSDLKSEVFTRSPYSGGNTLGPDGKNNISPDNESYVTLNITGLIEDAKLVTTFSYSDRQYREETVRKLSELYQKHLIAIIDHCLNKKETERTPSDFSFKGLDMEEVDDIFSQLADSLVRK